MGETHSLAHYCVRFHASVKMCTYELQMAAHFTHTEGDNFGSVFLLRLGYIVIMFYICFHGNLVVSYIDVMILYNSLCFNQTTCVQWVYVHCYIVIYGFTRYTQCINWRYANIELVNHVYTIYTKRVHDVCVCVSTSMMVASHLVV